MKNWQFIAIFLGVAAMVSSCGDDGSPSNETNGMFVDGEEVPSVDTTSVLDSDFGCTLDSDCRMGTFCFQNRCTMQCNDDVPCKSSETCSRRGRCLRAVASAPLAEAAEGSVLKTDEQDFVEAKQSGVVESLPGVVFLQSLPEAVSVKLGQTNVSLSFTTAKDYGTIHYIVTRKTDNSSTQLQTAEKTVNETTGATEYTISVPSEVACLGEDEGDVEYVRVDMSTGTAEIALVPETKASGLYKGTVTTPQFGGAALDIRMGIKISPESPSSFEKIESMTVYMPVAETEIFSPETPDTDAERWAELTLIKEPDPINNCTSQSECWVASFSTNNYDMPNSELLGADQKINRAIRVEISDYDASQHRFNGYVRDTWSGNYRVTDGKKISWSNVVMEGPLLISRQDDDFTTDDKEVRTHVAASPEYRNIETDESLPSYLCADDDIKTLFENKDKTKDIDDACSSITTLEQYKTAENASTCLLQASEAILNDKEHLVSNIIEQLIVQSPDDISGVGEYRNMSDFMEACAKPKGICKNRPEVACAADLLAHELVDAETLNLEKLQYFHQLLRESYIGPQYSAWLTDIETREDWLDNSTAPTFLSAQLEAINTAILDTWNVNVLDVHHDILHQQFTQATLELLSRVPTADSELVKSERKEVLGDFSEAWSALSDAAALAARRYDVLYQNDSERFASAKKLRKYLFDMYYAGIFESILNTTNDYTSLNAIFGSSISEVTNKIRSLDQTFDDLVYMRDAEIVVSTSLDPQSTSFTVLKERMNDANNAIAKAKEDRDTVFKEHEEKQISQAEIADQMTTNIHSLLQQMSDLCGLPSDCEGKIMLDSSGNLKKNCKPNTEVYKCGFEISSAPGAKVGSLRSISLTKEEQDKLNEDQCPGNPDKTEPDECGCILNKMDIVDGMYTCEASDVPDVNTSLLDVIDPSAGVSTGDAAEAILAYREAYTDYLIAVSDAQALYNKIQNSKAVTDAYEANLKKWHEDRVATLKKIISNVQALNEITGNMTEAEQIKLKQTSDELEAAYKKQEDNVTAWEKLKNTYEDETSDNINYIRDLTIAAMWMDKIQNVGNAMIGDVFSVFGLDKFAQPFGFGLLAVDTAINAIFSVVSGGLQTAIEFANANQAKADMKYEFAVELNDRNTELAIQELEKDLQSDLSYYKTVSDCKNIGKSHQCISEEKCVYIKNSDSKQEEENNTADDKPSPTGNPDTLTYYAYDSKCPNVEGYTLTESKKCDYKKKDNTTDGSGTITKYIDGGECPNVEGYTLTDSSNPNVTYYELGADQYALVAGGVVTQYRQINLLLKQWTQINEAYERDLQNLAEKRVEYRNQAQDMQTKQLQIDKAMIALKEAEVHYLSIVQKAQQVEAQYNAAVARAQEIENLYTTPAAIFSYASRLELVESEIETARDLMYDYLSAIEYLAVRPFVDLRRAIYIARSTDDLSAIMMQIDSIRNACGGGAPNTNNVTISVREMMGITTDFDDMTKAERFRYTMSKRSVPVDTLTRYTADSTVGDLLKQDIDLRVGTFEISIDRFANLKNSCNTKINRIGFKLIGENLIKKDAGEHVNPSLTLFYNGKSQLASCQPNMEAIVTPLGGKTSYGVYTTFNTGTKMISQTAGINAFGAYSNSLDGYPAASTYTIMIDPTISENSKINWDNVEDIELSFRYTFDDFYSSDSLCTSK